jgi:hypothetical protein
MADDVEWSRIQELTLQGRDGGELRLGRRPPATEAGIATLLARFAVPVTGTYVDFLRTSNGIDLFGISVSGTDPDPETNAEDWLDLCKRRLLPFHDWGNGDFDCLDLTKSVNGEPPVCFWNEEQGNMFPITSGFGRWTRMATFEVQTHGFLLHPRDYFEPRYADAQGVYESVANVKKTFFGPGADAPSERFSPPPRERRRDLLMKWLRR